MIRLYTVAANAVTVVENGSVRTMLEDRGARCVATRQQDPDTVYVGTSDEGLFKSPDGGEKTAILGPRGRHPDTVTGQHTK